jgi:hypothetical protein
MGKKRNASTVCDRKSASKRALEDLSLHGGMILKWILRKLDVKSWTGLICLAIGHVAGYCTFISIFVIPVSLKSREIFN